MKHTAWYWTDWRRKDYPTTDAGFAITPTHCQ